MKKIWPYISAFLLGAVIVLIGVVKWVDTTVYEGKVIIKQRGKGNTQDPQINVDIDSKKEGKLDRVKARLERKKARILKKSQK